MKNFFSAFAIVASAILPAGATPMAVDNGLMTVDPTFGPSRVETVMFCLNQAGVDKYQDLITDSHFATYGACMRDNT